MIDDLKVEIPSGTYVLAVSGGVDSMVLLDLLAKRPGLNLIVAHIDHGIRPESEQDRLLVQKVAQRHNLTFVFDKANLGKAASEAEARQARYKFLRSVKEASGARAIITAHHQDDIIETAIHNILRGTNRKGLNSLKSVDGIIRPMMHINKTSLYNYASKAGVEWHEDPTNQDVKYKRNYIRHKIVPRFSDKQRAQLVGLLNKTAVLNEAIDEALKLYLAEHTTGNMLSRYYFNILPHIVANEIMAAWLRQNGVRDFDAKLLDSLTIGAKTLAPGRRLDINLVNFLEVNKDFLALTHREC